MPAYLGSGVVATQLLALWRSQQVSNLSPLYTADGADVSLGVQEKKWSASAYMSLSRSSSQDGANYSGNYSLNRRGFFFGSP